MSDYFDRFMSQTRLKVDRDVAQRWQYDAQREGDKNIKAQMATARRTATSLENSIKQFSNLRPEQELAIKAAASAMRSLANDLQSLAVWGKAYKVFCDSEYKKERDARFEATAAKRWGDDESSFKFELELMRELATSKGRLAFGNWMHTQGMHLDAKPEDIQCPVKGLVHVAGEDRDRARAAATVHDGMGHRPQKWRGVHGVNVIGEWRDYEAYLQYRKDVARTTEKIMQMAS